MRKILKSIRKLAGSSKKCIFAGVFFSALFLMYLSMGTVIASDLGILWELSCLYMLAIPILCFVASSDKYDENYPRPIFYSVDEDGNTILTDGSTYAPFKYEETPLENGQYQVKLNLKSKEEAETALAAFEILLKKGSIDQEEYQRVKKIIKENFDV